MRLLLIVTGLLVWTGSLHGQENINKVHIGISFSPQVTISTFPKEAGKGNIPGWSASGDVYFQHNSRARIKSGLKIQSFGLKYRDNSPGVVFQVDTTEGDVDTFSSYWDINTNHITLGIPIQLQYALSDKASHFFVAGGIHLKTVISTKGLFRFVQTRFDSPIVDFYESPSRPSSFISSIMIGAGYEISTGAGKLFFMPQIDFSLNDFYAEKFSIRKNGKLSFTGLSIGWIFG